MGSESSCSPNQVAHKPRKSASRSQEQPEVCKISPANSHSSSTSTSRTTPTKNRTRGKSPLRLTGGPRNICSSRQKVVIRSQLLPAGTATCPESVMYGARKSGDVSMDQSGNGCIKLAVVVVSLLYEYARKLLLDSTRRGLLRLKCSTRFELEQKNSDLVFAGQTMLANLECGIDDVEKAIYNTDRNAKSEQLERAERIFNALIVLHTEGLTAGIPNAYGVGCAHVYLALIWKLKKNRQRAAAHLLETFVTSPGYARHDFAPELWDQMFRPHMISIESWYEREKNAIKANSSQYCSPIVKPSPPAPKPKKIDALLLQSVCHTDASMVNVTKQKRNSAEGYDSEKLMHMELLNNLYEEALNESTQHYAQYYQDCLLEYEERLDDQKRDKDSGSRQKGKRSSSHGKEEAGEFRNQLVQYSMRGQQQPADEKNLRQTPPPLRKSLFEAVFGTSMGKANRVFEDFMLKASCDNQYRQFCHHNAVYDSMEPAGKQTNDPKSLQSGRNSGVTSGEKTPGSTLVQVLKGDHFFLDTSEIKPITSAEKSTYQALQASSVKCLMDMLEETDSRLPSPFNSPFSIDTTTTGSDLENKVDTEFNVFKHLSNPSYYNKSCFPTTVEMLSKKTPETRAVAVMQPERKSGSHIKQLNFSKRSPTCKPPDVFICSLTKQLYIDPVTLETGHTYERVAIQKWLDNGSIICPVSGHTLQNLTLPMTNFTMKRLVQKWKEDNPQHVNWSDHDDGTKVNSRESTAKSMPIECTEGKLNSENVPEISHIVHNTIDAHENTKNALDNLNLEMSTSWNAKELSKCEEALLKTAAVWIELKGDLTVETYLMKAEVIDAFIYLLTTSKVKKVLKATIYILISLIQTNEFLKAQILRTDPELQSTFNVVKNGHIPEVVLLIFFLIQVPTQKQSLEIIPLLVQILHSEQVDDKMEFPGPLTPRGIALLMMEQAVTAFDCNTNLAHCKHAISLGTIPYLIESLDSKNMEERINATSVITRFMQADGDCRYCIATGLNISSILELLYVHGMKGRAVMAAMAFLCEVIRLNRRKSIINILTQIQKEGFLNSMHLLMVLIQCSPLENQPIAAGLLFMLDMLGKPHRYSLFREEALNALVAALSSEINIEAQINSARVLSDIGCHFSTSGESIIEAWLLKQAGLASCVIQDAPPACTPRAIMDDLKEEMEEEKMPSDNWDRRVAGALLSHGEPLIQALGKGLWNENGQVVRHCLVVVTWLSCFLVAERDEAIKAAVCSRLEPKMIEMVKPDHKGAIEERIFAALALQNYRRACMIKADPL